MVQHYHSMQKFQLMAQMEARMTVSKAIAIWKANSGVVGLTGELDNAHKVVRLHTMVLILSHQVDIQQMVTYNCLLEHTEAQKQ